MKSSLFLVVVVIGVSGLQVLARRTRLIINVETQSRIIGGYPIPIDKAPWTVSLLYCGDPICGGSIVSISKILTAAHCTAAGNTQDFLIRAGSSETMTGGQVREISEIIVHHRFSHDPAKGNDISMLFLTKPLILSANVAVIGLDKGTSALPSGIEVFTTGWGTTYDNGPRTLRAVSIQIIGNDRCSKMYEYEIFSSMLCAGLGGKGSCFGDSGGPLTFNCTLIGVVSFGEHPCAQPNFPAVYTRVSSFQDWIEEHL